MGSSPLFTLKKMTAMIVPKWPTLIYTGGFAVLSTYAWLLALLWRGSNRSKQAAAMSAGTLFKTTYSRLIWGISACVAVVSVFNELLFLLMNAVNDSYDPFFGPLCAFFVNATLWAPITFAVSYFKWPRILAAIPVWGTAFSNFLILLAINSVPGDKDGFYFFWTLSFIHHFVMDGIVWVWGFINMSVSSRDAQVGVDKNKDNSSSGNESENEPLNRRQMMFSSNEYL